MRPMMIAALALATSLFAVPAFAGNAGGPGHSGDETAADGAPHGGKRGQHAKSGSGKKFPMPAADFKQKIDQRLAKARAHMEQRAAKLPEGKAKEARASFEAGVAKVNAEVAKVTSDGTVTKDEAGQVRATMKEVRSQHGGRHTADARRAP
jgi:hypothetical protein